MKHTPGALSHHAEIHLIPRQLKFEASALQVKCL